MRADLHLQLPARDGFCATFRAAPARGAAAVRLQHWRERLAQPPSVDTEILLGPVFRQVLVLAAWLLVLVLAVISAAICVAPALVFPMALALTAGLWLIATGVRLARQLRLASLWWRALALLRRGLSADNLCRLVFIAGTLLALWNLSGLQPERALASRAPPGEARG